MRSLLQAFLVSTRFLVGALLRNADRIGRDFAVPFRSVSGSGTERLGGTVRSACWCGSERCGEGHVQGAVAAPDGAARTLRERTDGAPERHCRWSKRVRDRAPDPIASGRCTRLREDGGLRQLEAARRAGVPGGGHDRRAVEGCDGVHGHPEGVGRDQAVDDHPDRASAFGFRDLSPRPGARDGPRGGRAEFVERAPAAADDVAGTSGGREGEGRTPRRSRRRSSSSTSSLFSERI